MAPGRRPTHGTRPTSTSTTPARAMRRPKAMRILPMSFIVAGTVRPDWVEGGLREARAGSARRCSWPGDVHGRAIFGPGVAFTSPVRHRWRLHHSFALGHSLARAPLVRLRVTRTGPVGRARQRGVA